MVYTRASVHGYPARSQLDPRRQASGDCETGDWRLETGEWRLETGVESQESGVRRAQVLPRYLGRPQPQRGTGYRAISQISTHHPPSYPTVPPRHTSGPSRLVRNQKRWQGVSTLLHETADSSGRPMFPKLRFCNPRARQLLPLRASSQANRLIASHHASLDLYKAKRACSTLVGRGASSQARTIPSSW